MRHRQRVTHGHGGIHRVTALLKNFHPHFRCGGIHRGDHAVLSRDRMESISAYAIGNRRSGRSGTRPLPHQ